MNFGQPIPPKFLFWLVVAILLGGGALMLRALSSTTLTANESLLLSVLLTLFSIGAGWLVSHTLYQDSRSDQIQQIRDEYERNLEIYAVKASEKVINLSNQIGRVVEYLEANDENGADSIRFRHAAAIHMLGTLKSINDTSLSDWEGVIGDRLDAKRKLDQQRDSDVNAILEEIRSLSFERIDFTRDELMSLANELKSVSRTEVSLPPSRRGMITQLPCPECSSAVRLKTNAKGGIRKTAARCSNCNKSLAVIGGDTSAPHLERRIDKPEQVACPTCAKPNAVLLDNAAPSHKNFNCSACGTPAIAHRLRDGVQSRTVDGSKAVSALLISQEFIDQVEMLLPDQPWPSGIHRDVADKLGCSPSKVNKATRALIKSGKFREQKDGVIVDSPAEEIAEET